MLIKLAVKKERKNYIHKRRFVYKFNEYFTYLKFYVCFTFKRMNF